MHSFLNKLFSICRTIEVRALFFVGYLLLLMWPFFTAETLSFGFLYKYYHSIWGVLVVGLILQGYLVIHSDKADTEPPKERLGD